MQLFPYNDSLIPYIYFPYTTVVHKRIIELLCTSESECSNNASYLDL